MTRGGKGQRLRRGGRPVKAAGGPRGRPATLKGARACPYNPPVPRAFDTHLPLPLKSAVKSLLATPLGWRVARATVRAPGLIVLMYHRVGVPAEPFRTLDVRDFRRQMLWVRRHCRPIAPEDLEDAVQRPDRFRPPVLVTFDDGFRDYHDHAYPVLKELGIPAVVFLTTGFMDEGGLLWSDALRWALSRTRRERAPLPEGGSAAIGGPGHRRAFLATWGSGLKRVS